MDSSSWRPRTWSPSATTPPVKRGLASVLLLVDRDADRTSHSPVGDRWCRGGRCRPLGGCIWYHPTGEGLGDLFCRSKIHPTKGRRRACGGRRRRLWPRRSAGHESQGAAAPPVIAPLAAPPVVALLTELIGLSSEPLSSPLRVPSISLRRPGSRRSCRRSRRAADRRTRWSS